MQESHRLIINSFSVFCRVALTMVIGLVLPPFVVHQLGRENFGVAVVVASVLNVIMLVQTGVPAATSRFVAAAKERGDRDELNRVMGTSLAFLLACAGIGIVLVGLFACWPELLLTWPASMPRQTVQWVIIIMGILAVLGMPLGIGNVTFAGRERYVLLNLVHVGGSFLRFFMVYGLLLVFPGSIIAYAASHSGAMAITFLVTFLLAMFLNKDSRISLAFADAGMLRRMLSFGVVVMFADMATLLYVQADYFLIGRLLNLESVTIFSLSVLWFTAMHRVLSSMIAVVIPAAARNQAAGNNAALLVMFVRATKYGLLVTIVPLSIFFFYRFQLMDVWMGPGYGEVAVLMVPILVTDIFFYAAMGGAQMLTGLGHPRILLVTTIICGVLNVGLALLLGIVLEMGLMGFSLAYMIAMLVRNVIILPAFFMKVFQLQLGQLFIKCYFRPLLCTVATVPMVYVVWQFIPGLSWFRLFLAAVVIIALYIPLVGWIGMDAYDRNVVFRLVVKAAAKLGIRR